MDAKAVGQGAQLLERLEALEGNRPEPRVLAQERCTVGVDADVAVGRETRWQRADAARERVAGPRNGGAAEGQGVTLAVQDDFHDVRVVELARAANRVARGRHGRVAVAG